MLHLNVWFNLVFLCLGMYIAIFSYSLFYQWLIGVESHSMYRGFQSILDHVRILDVCLENMIKVDLIKLFDQNFQSEYKPNQSKRFISPLYSNGAYD